MIKRNLDLHAAKTSQDTDISTKIIKENADIFSDFLFKTSISERREKYEKNL